MVMELSTTTEEALENAGRDGLVVRYLLTIKGRNREDNSPEEINMWTGELPMTIQYINPKTLAVESRVFQAGAGWLTIPAIPQKIELEARSIRLSFSRIPPAAINIIRAYDPKLQAVWIHRALYNPSTRVIVDPAYCLFNGFVNKAPITIPETGGTGTVDLECSSNSRYLTRTRGDKFSDEYLKRRDGDRFGRYLDVAGLWRVFWGEEDAKVGGKGKKHRRERFST